MTKRREPRQPVEMLADRRAELEADIRGCDRELRAIERRRDRVTENRTGLLAELAAIEEGIKALGGVPEPTKP